MSQDQIENLERQIADLKKDMKMLDKVEGIRKKLHLPETSTMAEIFAELDEVLEQAHIGLALIEANQKL